MGGGRLAVWAAANEAQPSSRTIESKRTGEWIVDRCEELDWIGTDVPGGADPSSVSQSDGDVDDSWHPTWLEAQNESG